MKELLQYKKYSFVLIVLFILSIITALIIFKQIENNHSDHVEQYNKIILQEAISHFEDILISRKWNAEHGGVYVKQENGLEPNPYLKDNILKIDNNNTLIKINPAWMTRQFSELSNKNSKRYYKITSLKPLNPHNKADSFETEGLKYLEKNPNEKYYYQDKTTLSQGKLAIDAGENPMFDFIGRLDTDETCLTCHAVQGYKVGDLRGGIRISLPISKYRHSINLENSIHSFNKYLVSSFIGLLSLLTGLIIFLFFREQSSLKSFNLLLKQSVDSKTKDLHELNQLLEEKIAAGILKNAEKDKLIITQSRHAAMGEMISMIAHQWRQPLGAISLDASTLILDIELDDINKEMFKEYAEGILEQTDYLSKTIDDFRNFFRQEKEKVSILPSEVVNECFKIVGESLRSHDISYEIVCKSEQLVQIYTRELLQVLINILNNAKDALCELKEQDRHINVTIDKNTRDIIILICDNGTGIDEEVLSHIFEPYFTTKENKNGTGLGLHMSKMIIDQHFNGNISVSSDKNSTCFKISFPLA